MCRKVLIYQDYGCADVRLLESALKTYFEPRGCQVGFTDAAEIIKNNALNDEVLAFFIPGGAGTPFRHKLEYLGNDKIRSYVENGGIYYGICAGAYYACRQTVFEADIPELKIIQQCGLNLVDGNAVGTLHKELHISPYAKSAAAAAAVELIWADTGEKHTAHYHGGPYFQVETEENCRVLAYYDLNPPLPAIISKKFGRGTAVLSGVHYEDDGKTMLRSVHQLQPDFDAAVQVARKLCETEPSRLQMFRKLMALTGRV